MADHKLHRYDSREQLAEGLSSGVAAILAGALASRGSATLVVSGGSTPKLFFDHLSKTEIDWSHVTVTLVDERWVPETNERSNAAMLRDHLLKNAAAAAHFVSPYMDAETPEAVIDDLEDRFHRIARPFDVVVLGMGTDGHTASFFPGGDTLDQALDPSTRRAIVAMRADGASEPRITLTLPLIVDARFVALHIEGADKMAAYEAAARGGPIEAMPVRAVLDAPRTEPVNIFWAP